MIDGNLATKTTRLCIGVLSLPFLPMIYLVRGICKILHIISVVLPKRIDGLLSKYARHSLAKYTSVDSSTIAFITMQGEYTCNPKYIAEEILRRDLPYRLLWIIPRGRFGPVPESMELLKRGSAKYYLELSRARIVIQNGHTLQRTDVGKRDGQTWLQTWHGSLGLKRLEGAGGRNDFFDRMRSRQTMETDFLISNSSFENDVYGSTYWPGVPILKLGHARNDILFNQTQDSQRVVRQEVLDRLNIEDSGQQFILFAPTQNDGAGLSGFGELDWNLISETFAERFGGSWEVLIRLHHTDKARVRKMMRVNKGPCHDATPHPDMQELLAVADAGITNYSSWICDFIVQEKPSFIFGADIEDYASKRGFYHDFDDTPFTATTSLDELLAEIRTFDHEIFAAKVKDFIQNCGSVDDGKASARIVDSLEKMMSS